MSGPTQPVGCYRFDLPYGAPPPRLTSPELGLRSVVARAGHHAAYTMDITLLDAPDHRLVRSGVLLAHRVVDGRGEWYLGAPDWEPLLPAELIEPMSQAELPDRFADLVAPFRRRGTLGPVAAIRCERAEFAVRDDTGHPSVLLRDDKVTVRRGGLTTARYREVLLTGVGPGLDADRLAFLQQAFGRCGATQVPRFPRLVARLGAPATGLTDFPVATATAGAQSESFGSFVAALLADRQRELLEADLRVRGGTAGAADGLGAAARRLWTELQALSAVLPPRWVEDLAEELDWLVAQTGSAAEALPVRLRGERYLTLLERLVTAVRAPQLGDSAAMPATEVLAALVGASVAAVVQAGDRVRVDDAQQRWDELDTELAAALGTVAVAARAEPEHDRRIGRRLATLRTGLDEVGDRSRRLAGIRADALGRPAAEAFEAGRDFEREQLRSDVARESFRQAWPKAAAKLVAAVGPAARRTERRKKRRR